MAFFPCLPKPKFKKIRTDLTARLSDAPYICNGGSAVTLNGEVHILGGGGVSSTRRQHYKWDGTKWLPVSTLPIDLYYGSAVVYNGKIHIFSVWSHYEWNGSTWTKLGELPYNVTESSAVVYKGDIYLLGGSSSGTTQNFYKWNDYTDTWTALRGLAASFRGRMATVFRDSIYVVGYSSQNYWSRWDGSTWTFGNGPTELNMYNFLDANDGFLIVVDDSMYLYYKDARVRFDGTDWTFLSRRVPHPSSVNTSWVDTKFHPNKIHNGCVAADDMGVHIICLQNSSSEYDATHVLENMNIYIPA